MPSIEQVADYYDKLGDDYDKQTYDYMRNRRMQYLKREITGRKILDIGCNCGDLIKMYKTTEDVVGIDISEKSLKIGKENVDAEFVKADAARLPFQDNSFDCVIVSESLYYLDHPEHCVKEAFQKLKPGGKLIILFSNQLYNRLGRMFGPILGVAIKDAHERLFYPSEVLKMVKDEPFEKIYHEGFAVVPVKGMEFFDFFLPKLIGFDHLVTAYKGKEPNA